MHRLLYFVFGCMVLWNSVASAWWEAGHMSVAQIAYEELNPEVKDKVNAYLEAVSGPFPNHSDFVMASLWADDIVEDGVDSFFTWHISSRPYDPDGILTEQQHEKILTSIKGNDIVWAIQKCVKTLKNPESTIWAKGFCLRFLIHMVGDIHQPFHCVSLYNERFPNGDRGGNEFKIKHDTYTSLHKLSDAAFGLGDRQFHRPMTQDDKQCLDDLVCALRERHPRETLDQLSEPNVDAWRQESYDIGVNFAYLNLNPDETPSDEVMEEGRVVMGGQIALGGYRLADLLNEILG